MINRNNTIESTNTEKAVDFIINNCLSIGQFNGSNEVKFFIEQVALDMDLTEPNSIFPDRYKEHVAYAIREISKSDFLESQSVISSVFLLTRFEYFFRILSGKLKSDGSWISENAKTHSSVLLNEKKLKNKINNLSIPYKIIAADPHNDIGRIFREIDNILFPSPITTCFYHLKTIGSKTYREKIKINSIGDRIEVARNDVSHGRLADI